MKIKSRYYLVIGPQPNANQDSFMYRAQNGVRSLLLDDDNCDCYSTLSMGHGMCTSSFSTSYGPSGRFGVDLLYDTYCQTPDPKRGLALYFKGWLHFNVPTLLDGSTNPDHSCVHEASQSNFVSVKVSCYAVAYTYLLGNTLQLHITASMGV